MLSDSETIVKHKCKKDNDTASQSEDNLKIPSILPISTFDQKIFTSPQKILIYFEFFSMHSQSTKLMPLSSLKKTVNDKKILSSEFHLFRLLQNLREIIENNNKSKTQQNNMIVLDKKSSEFLSNFQKNHGINLIQSVTESKRFKQQKSFTKEILIHQIFPSKHHQIIKMQIQLLQFKTQILILNQLDKSSLRQFGYVSNEGSFGSVYFVEFLNQKYCIKSVPFENDQKINLYDQSQNHYLNKNCQTLISTLKQYFLLLLFSQLQIGPKVQSIGGFDIIIYEDSIQFATQICNQPSYNEKNLQILKQNLFKMHMLQIVHRDIKPGNIMFSPTFNKNVFIDFGGSEILMEALGQKTITQFIGTASYCYEQVFLLLSQKNMSVDLYYNDIYGLRKSIQELSSQNILFEQSNQNIMNQINMYTNCMRYQGNSDFELIELKYSSYTGDEQTFEFIWRYLKLKYLNMIETIERKILEFFKEVKPTQFLRRFYSLEISEQTKNLPQFSGIKVMFKNQSCELLSYLNINNDKAQSFNNYKVLFKMVEIQSGNFSLGQGKIQKFIMNKSTLIKSLEQIKLALQDQNISQGIKNENFIKFNILVAIFCSISENSLKISFQQKVDMSLNALEIIKKVDKKYQQKSKTLFVCQQANINSLNVFYHYFFFAMFNKIPQKYKPQLMVRTISTLFLLGLPKSSQKYEMRKILNNLVVTSQIQKNEKQLSQQKLQQIRMQKILLFWQCKLVFLFFDNVFYIRKHQNAQKCNRGQNQTFCANQLLIMEPNENQQSPFFKLNYFFYINIYRQYQNLDQKRLDQLLSMLSSPIFLQLEQSSKLIKKWKRLMYIVICYFSSKFKMFKSTYIRKLIQKQHMLESNYNKVILPYLIFFYFEQISGIYFQSYFVLQKIDQIIGQKQISLRFELQKRLLSSLSRRNFKKTNQIFQMIEKQIVFDFLYEQNVKYVHKIVLILGDFLLNYLKDLPDLNQEFIKLLKGFQSIIIIGMEVGIKYFQQINNSDFRREFQTLELNQIDIFTIDKQIQQTVFKEKFLSTLIFIGKIFDQVSNLAQSNYQRFFLDQSDKSHHLKLPEKYCLFLNNLKKNRLIFEFNEYWMNTIKNNKQFRQKVKSNRIICMRLATFFLQQRKKNIQIEKSNQVIQTLFEDISADHFLDENNSNSSDYLIALDYFIVKLLKSKFDSYWCNQFIKMYRIFLNKNLLDQILWSQRVIQILFNSYIYTQKSYSEIQSLITSFTKLLKKSPYKKHIQLMKNNFEVIFTCSCQYCFPRKVQNWDCKKFTQHLYLSLDFSQIQQNPYMSLVYFYSMKRELINIKIRTKFIIYILKSLPFLSSSTKDVLFPELYEYIYATIEPYPFQMIVNIRRHPQALKIPKIRYEYRNQKMIRKYLYLCNQFRKNQHSDLNTLEQLSQKRLVRQYCVLNYEYPPQIREKYVKKLRRYHEIKGNYRQKQKIVEIVNSKKHFLLSV